MIATAIEIVGVLIAAGSTVMATLIASRASFRRSRSTGLFSEAMSSSGRSMRIIIGLITIFAIINVVIIATAGSNGAPNPKPTHTSTAGLPVSGSITSPKNGASDISRLVNLQATGTAHNIKPGHHLELFVSVIDVNRYFASSPYSITLTGTRWTGIFFVGFSALAHFTLWLVDLGPKSFRVLNANAYDQNHGFPSLKLGSDTTILFGVTLAVR